MPLTAGTKLGPYEILAPLGAGGMGEVYRARDGKLGREVAIKTLPSEFTRDVERLARFEREAKLLAALNHPNVAAIYGLEESSETRFLVLELVPGETLSEKLASGPLPVEEALGISRQVAEALEAAHAQGIVHRDLKPANIKVTPVGKVKVLDFGLAKAFAPEAGRSGDISHSPTVTSGGTQKGVILGTAAYMSPEQARGKAVDRRTDIWSFGCVLYETLAGRKAFEGETVSDVMASVLTREPGWDALPPSVPSRIRDLLRRCLRKDPGRRLHDIADARIEIEDAIAEPDAAAATGPAVALGRRGIGVLGLFAIAVVSAAVAALATKLLTKPQAPAGSPEVLSLRRFTPPTARSEWPNWSPDGSLLAYASNRSGNYEIYVRRGEGGQDVNITNDPGQDVQPAFSPDGGSIAFISTRSSKTGLIKIGGTLSRNSRTFGGDLWVTPALGGAAHRLAEDANSPAWRPDGRSVLYVTGSENRRAIMEVPTGGGTSHSVLSGEQSTWEIIGIGCSPDGRWISFETQLDEVFLMPASGGKPTLVGSGFSHAWDASSQRLWALSREADGGTRIQCADLDDGRPAVRGQPRSISISTAYLRDLAVARDGRHLVVSEEETSRNVTRLPLSPAGDSSAGPEEPLSSGRVIDGYPNVSPDGKSLAYISDILGRREVWLLDLATRKRERLQLPGEDLAQGEPAWLADGKQVVVHRYMRGADHAVWIASIDGSHSEEISRGRVLGTVTLQPSPDGRSVLMGGMLISGVQQIIRYDLASRKEAAITSDPGDKFDGVWSPDGRWIAITAAKGGTLQLFRMPASGGAMQQLTTGFERMRHPFYSPDGKWIYIQPSHRNIYRVAAEGGPLQQVTRFPEAGLFLEEPTISPDGRYLYYCRENGASSLWLMTLSR
ncbi:MAG TPA: protein kinase [Thermoanaerobaculia bacterium]|nr:protein kinase [Thermoanaerobaculia bacterium]